ncbi:MAG: hypothetical protein E6I47_04640 [Chloroflexi bacterium]|nr:MAG: hypothetical protein E6I47_04640 [Chloroflexota bacterium]
MGSAIAPYRSSLPASAPGRGLVSYVTSRRNLTGSALALVGAGLILIDPVGVQGLFLVVGLYLAGALSVRSNGRVSRFGFDPERVQKSLADQIGVAAGRVPPEIHARMQRIELTIRTEILPRLDCLPLGAPELYLIERTVSDYLPTAVEAYLRLPRGYVSSQPGSQGRAALDVVVEELDFLDAEMRQVAEVVHRTDMDQLLAHKRFLADRFRRDATGG